MPAQGDVVRGDRRPRATPAQVAARTAAGRTHLAAAWDHASGLTIGQVACADERAPGGEVAATRR